MDKFDNSKYLPRFFCGLSPLKNIQDSISTVFCKWNHFSLRLIKCIPGIFVIIKQHSIKLAQKNCIIAIKLLHYFYMGIAGDFGYSMNIFSDHRFFPFFDWVKLNLSSWYGGTQLLIVISTTKCSLLTSVWLPHSQLWVINVEKASPTQY